MDKPLLERDSDTPYIVTYWEPLLEFANLARTVEITDYSGGACDIRSVLTVTR